MTQNLFNIPFEADFLESFIDHFTDLDDSIIILPTKRACRSLKEKLLNRATSKVIQLPKMIALSDIDLSFLLPLVENEADIEPLLSMPQPINALKKFFLLTQMIMKASVLTKSIYQAGKLAGDLGSLITQIHDEQCDPQKLNDLVPEKYATHWQKSLDFLTIISLHWPEILKGFNAAEPSDLRNQYLEIFIDFIAQKKIQSPIYILGTNASLPVVKKLVSTVINREKGTYVFHGLNLDEGKVIAESDPQYSYHQLLDYCEKKILDVHDIKVKKTAPKITYLPCKRLSEEAQICATILRETLVHKNQNCALITNNVDLIKQIKAVLKIWDIEINDSSGEPLDQTRHFDFIKLIFESYQNPDSKLIFLSLLKHPLCQVNMDRGQWLKAIRSIEKKYFRTKKEVIETIYDWREVDIFEPILTFFDTQFFEDQLIISWIDLTIAALEFFSNGTFFNDETGEVFLKLFEDIKLQSTDFDEIDLSFYLILLEQIVKQNLSYEQKEVHPRLTILGPYEARLQHFDRVIIASCNEENWLSQSANPWLSQSMLKALGLPSFEEKQGRIALDFFQLLGNEQVFITRSLLDQGSPMTMLRWLDDVEYDQDSEVKWFEYLKFYNQVLQITNSEAPEPRPRIDARPKQFSVSDIELLIRDPYSIYAKKILKLRPTDPVDPPFNMAEYGSFIHLFLYALKAQKTFEIEKEILNFPTLLPFKLFFIPKLEQVKAAFLQVEQTRSTKNLLLEKKGEVMCGDVKITAIADRIDLGSDSEYEIIDYKTGMPPMVGDIQSGYSPQCILEAMILKAGGFGIKTILPIKFAFWQIGKSFKIKMQMKQIEEDMAHYEAGLKSLFHAFDDPDMPYYAQPFPLKSPRYNDYLHLSRVKEWLN